MVGGGRFPAVDERVDVDLRAHVHDADEVGLQAVRFEEDLEIANPTGTDTLMCNCEFS